VRGGVSGPLSVGRPFASSASSAGNDNEVRRNRANRYRIGVIGCMKKCLEFIIFVLPASRLFSCRSRRANTHSTLLPFYYPLALRSLPLFLTSSLQDLYFNTTF
jgi:hypothetical protein